MNPELVLVRAPHLTVEVLPHAVVVYAAGRLVPCGPHGLQILAAFGTPRRYGEALEALGAEAKTPADWIAMTAAIQQMVAGGALRELANLDAAPDAGPEGGYENPRLHVEMLDLNAKWLLAGPAVPQVLDA